MLDDATIIAVATPPGRSAISVIRLSGPKSTDCLMALTRSQLPEPRRASRRWLWDATEQRIDDAIVLFFAKPYSYTGFDCVELHLHGSPAIAESVLQTCLDMQGVRLARAGEFTRQALLAGKLDLHQVEATAELIDADTSAQISTAIAQMDGKSHRQLTDWRSRFHKIAVDVEAALEFGEEEGDVDQAHLSQVEVRLSSLRAEIATISTSQQTHQLVRDGLSVVLTGPVNAGKSTLFNAFVGSDLAIVHDSPGTTRDVLEVRLDLNGQLVRLKDTAGLRHTDNAVEQMGIERATHEINNADIRLYCVDAVKWASGETPLPSRNSSNDLLVLTKSDLVSRETIQATQFDLVISAMHAPDMARLRQALSKRVDQICTNTKTECSIILNRRQTEALKDILFSLEGCMLARQCGDLALLAEELRSIDHAFAHVLGLQGAEKLLDDIFSTFCIGK